VADFASYREAISRPAPHSAFEIGLMRLVFTTNDAEKFGERVIVLLIGGAWLAQAPFRKHHSYFRPPVSVTRWIAWADPRRAIEDPSSNWPLVIKARRAANARKFQDYSGVRGNYKYAAN
jgi:hypothetical protein